LYDCIAQLIAYAETRLGLEKRDEIYIRNRLFDLLGLDGREPSVGTEPVPELPDAILQGVFSLLEAEGREFDRAVLGEKLMDAVMLKPSEHEKIFAEKYAVSAREATAWAYGYAVHSDYVKKSAIDKNLKWTSKNGALEITINLSKPEKNNKDLQKQLTKASTDYPKCTICRENEGFERAGFSRRNMRTVSMKLGGEDWFWQYSPYAYFNEHGIAISCAHVPMTLDGNTAGNLFDFVERFPHYFIGNNAPLPRVGGSILMHNHYQGGGAVLPMQRAGARFELISREAPNIKISALDWYNTALRFEGENRAEIALLAERVFTAWKDYENAALDILPYSGSEPHNTASCIARKTQTGYILDLILRNNRTDARYPDGIFHAHGEYHHIKSESIGLIEAMGLFILPARLKRQLGEIKDYLTGERKYTKEKLAEDMRIFVPTIERLLAGGKKSAAQAEDLLRDEVENACEHILDNTAVFKRDESGERALKEFLNDCGLQLK
ncbi:MAG: UDP-glucose--hexose-1-phosphate uridylyltransferase, partial [Clostridia bacterium]|nr:UDP-glucose--hexose-1-phosphate uridylyltransferase [Clostridia bacterium]